MQSAVISRRNPNEPFFSPTARLNVLARKRLSFDKTSTRKNFPSRYKTLYNVIYAGVRACTSVQPGALRAHFPQLFFSFILGMLFFVRFLLYFLYSMSLSFSHSHTSSLSAHTHQIKIRPKVYVYGIYKYEACKKK